MYRGAYAPLCGIGEFMKNIKVIFKSNKAPSGMNPHTEYMIGAQKLKNLQKDGRFDIEVLEKPKEVSEKPKEVLDKPKAKKKAKATKKTNSQ